MSKVRWRALSVLVTVAAIILAMSFQAWSQICSCDQGACSSQTPPRGPSESSFTIPLGLIAAALAVFLEKFGVSLPSEATIVIPDIKITLSRSLMGDAYVTCPSPCCTIGRLGVEVWLLLAGEASLGPPIPPAKVTTCTRVKSVKDNDSKDQNKEACAVETDFELSRGGVSVSLILPGGITVPLYGEAEGTVGAAAQVYCGCRVGYAHSYLNREPNLSVPTKVIMSVDEREAEFHFWAEDPDLDPLWIEAKLFGVSGEVSVSQDGQGKITLSPGAQIDERTEASVSIRVYDLKRGEVVAGSPRAGQYYHSVSRSVPLRFIHNHRPQACDIDGTIYLGSSYPEQFSCVVVDPDGDSLWGPLWLSPLPPFCFDWSTIQRERIYMLVECEPRFGFAKVGDYVARYLVWDSPYRDSYSLWSEGTVTIHVLENKPPDVEE